MASTEATTASHSPRSSSPRKVVGCSERLAGLRPKSPPVLPDLVATKHLSKDALEKHLHTIYAVAVDRKKKAEAANASIVQHREETMLQYGGAKQHRTPGEVLEIVQRLNDDHIKEKTVNGANLLKRYEDEYKKKNRTHINEPTGVEVLSPKIMKASVHRLYDASIEKGREHMQALVSQYCPPKTSPRRTKDELAASSMRMWKGEK